MVNYSQQHTLATVVQFEGIGLHSGQSVTMALHPAPANTGIVFRRDDLQGSSFRIQHDAIQDAFMCSNFVINDFKVMTIEHIMSALAGLSVDNVIIALNSPEVPIMDGSSLAFVQAIQRCGVVEQPLPRKYIKILQEIKVTQDDKEAYFLPLTADALSSPSLQLHFKISFQHPAFTPENSSFAYQLKYEDSNAYLSEIAAARTFGFMRDVEQLHARGLALGGSLDNAVVLNDQHILNPEGLRFNNEMVRHKVLDAIGDLYIAGYPIIGEYHAYKSGHALNNALLKALFNQPNCFIFVNL